MNINVFLSPTLLVDKIEYGFRKSFDIEVSKLHTSNRLDIDYRIDFLDSVINKGLSYEETLYFYFISDDRRGVKCDAKEMSEKFINLYHLINGEGIKKPLKIRKYKSEILNTYYLEKGEKHLAEFQNVSGYQLIEGAHRLAIFEFLGLKKIPVKLSKFKKFDIPNYTKFIRAHEKVYRDKISKLLKQ